MHACVRACCASRRRRRRHKDVVHSFSECLALYSLPLDHFERIVFFYRNMRSFTPEGITSTYSGVRGSYENGECMAYGRLC